MGVEYIFLLQRQWIPKKNLYVVDICLFLESLQLQQKSLKDDTSLASKHNIIAYRFLT